MNRLLGYRFSKTAVLCAKVFHRIGGRPFLWAKHGPVWLKEQSPAREARLRQMLVREVRRREPRTVFIRMHARYRARDTLELLSTITYDRTYVIDLTPREPKAIAGAMPRAGRRGVLRAERVAREAGCTIAEETGLSREEFESLYAVMSETARRDGFRPHPSDVYWDMLTTLGPEHARLFVLRRDGEPHCWDLVTVSGKRAVAYYGASSSASRGFRGAEALDWFVARTMAAEGCDGLDLMGADSARVPELYGVRGPCCRSALRRAGRLRGRRQREERGRRIHRDVRQPELHGQAQGRLDLLQRFSP